MLCDVPNVGIEFGIKYFVPRHRTIPVDFLGRIRWDILHFVSFSSAQAFFNHRLSLLIIFISSHHIGPYKREHKAFGFLSGSLHFLLQVNMDHSAEKSDMSQSPTHSSPKRSSTQPDFIMTYEIHGHMLSNNDIDNPKNWPLYQKIYASSVAFAFAFVVSVPPSPFLLPPLPFLVPTQS